MDRMIYLAMTGAKQTEYAQAINGNNLANASTTGFRADLHAFSAEPVAGSGLASRVNAVVRPYATSFAQGPVVNTGRDLDVAIQGEGFIAVQGADGREGYTRAGDLRIGAGGILTTGAGHPVMGEGGPVAIPPSSSILVGADGTISVQPLGQGPETLAVIDRIRLVNPDTARLAKGADGLLYLPGGETAAPSADVRLTAGALEHSNVNVAETLVTMIELARRYEMQINVIGTAKEDADAAAELMRIA
ncbi:MAG TPA: flagellar basal body rod protein FlgF [Woeseiaceae bacterium]|nr:flagellar basal body rod protein FlgF [Woeseiaceae bacterium]